MSIQKLIQIKSKYLKYQLPKENSKHTHKLQRPNSETTIQSATHILLDFNYLNFR